MSVPLSNLYNWVESLLPDPAVLYVFHPHGSKKISNCNWLRDYDVSNVWRLPGVIMHDQEPLDWEYYNLPTLWSDVDILKKETGQNHRSCCLEYIYLKISI